MTEIKELTVEYGKLRALDRVSFSVADGEAVALVGANGAGKSTLLLSMVGVLPLASGSVTVDGVTLTKKTLGEIRRRVGLVFQNPDDMLFMPLVGEDVAFGPKNYGCPPEEAARRRDNALDAMGISHLADRPSAKLSGGEKRAVSIAAALAMEPSLLLLDEPTAFLDPRGRRRLLSQLRALPQSKLIATHDLDFARKICTRAVILQDGRVVAEGGIELLSDETALVKYGL